jgi:hypothetical protein
MLRVPSFFASPDQEDDSPGGNKGEGVMSKVGAAVSNAATAATPYLMKALHHGFVPLVILVGFTGVIKGPSVLQFARR